MKKFLKIFFISVGIFLFLVIAAAIIVPIAFKGKILTTVKEKINENVNAKVEFADFRLSLIRSFPNLNIALTGLSVVGIDDFESDTLVSFDSFSASIGLLDYLKGDGINIRSVLLDHPVMNAIVLEDGKANWDIAKPTADVEEELDTTASEMPDLQVQLKKFEIREADISYHDYQANMNAVLDNLNFILSGDMSRELTTLNLNSSIGAIDFYMNNIRYLREAQLSFRSAIEADMQNMKFTLEDNEFALNALILGFEGEIAMPGEDIVVDMTFQTKATTFKSLLSMVPAIYMKDFESVEADGVLALEGYARGTYSSADSTLPDAGITLMVDNARFSYPGLPKTVENVTINTSVSVDGKDLDNTTVDVNTFHIELGDNPFDANLHIKTPISDPEVSGKMDGRIDLATLADVVPMEEVSIKGIIETDLDFGGRMSMIENERYEDFRANGSIEIEGLMVASPDLPQQILIPAGIMKFSPRYVEISKLDILLGESDMHFVGRMENFIPYVFSDGTVMGEFTFSSAMLDLNALMPEAAEEEIEVEDTTELAVIEVPDHIDFVLTSELEKIYFNNLEIDNAIGKIVVKEQKLILDGLDLNAMQGTISVEAEYNTQSGINPIVTMNLDVKNVDIPSAYNSFVTIQKMAPIAKGLNGKVSTTFTFTSLIDEKMMPVISTIDGYGKLRSEEVELVSSTAFDKLKGALKLKDDLTNRVKDVNVSFTISEGRINVEPFETKMGDIKMVVGGSQGLDQTMNYKVKMGIPRDKFGTGANQVVDNLAAQAAAKGFDIQPGKLVNVDAGITGTFTDPRISLDLRESMDNAMEDVKEQVKERVVQEVEEVKEEVIEKIDEEKEKLKAEADKRAQEIIDRATKLRDDAMAEATDARDKAYVEAKRIEDKAKGKILEQAKAKLEAEGIRKAADIAYNKAEQLANNEYQKALERAEEERGRIK